MNLALVAIAVSILSLIATLAFGTPPWVNAFVFFSGIAGLCPLSRKRG